MLRINKEKKILENVCGGVVPGWGGVVYNSRTATKEPYHEGKRFKSCNIVDEAITINDKGDNWL